MSDQKRGERYHSELNEGWYALLAHPNALTRLPQIVADVAAIEARMSTILEMPSEKYPNGREWATDGIRSGRIDQEYVDAQKALAAERQRLERAVVDAAKDEVKTRDAFTALDDEYLVRRILDRWRNDMPVIRVAWNADLSGKHNTYMSMRDSSQRRSALLYNSRMGLAAREKR